MSKPFKAYAVTYGMPGYMPDSHYGSHTFATRAELAGIIRDYLALCDMPASEFAQVGIRRLWHFIARNGASSAHFAIYHGNFVLEFHGLTESEYAEQTADEY